MRTTATLLASSVAAMLAWSPATAGRMTDFDLDKLDSWSDAIAVCDVTRYLLSAPDIDVDAIRASENDNARLALFKPMPAPPNTFYSQAMRLTFEQIKQAGLVSDDSYNRARLHYGATMIGAYGNATAADKTFMSEQMELCYALAVRAGVKLTPAMRGKP